MGNYSEKGPRVCSAMKSFRELREWNSTAARNDEYHTVLTHWSDVFDPWPGYMQDGKRGPVHYCTGCGNLIFKRFKRCQCDETYVTEATMQHVRNYFFRYVDACDHLIFLIPTKYPENILSMWPGGERRNVALGISFSTQEEAESRMKHLSRALHLSGIGYVEALPLTEKVDLLSAGILFNWRCDDPACGWQSNNAGSQCERCGSDLDCDYTGIDWVVTGGQSGGNADPTELEWIRAVTHQCRAAKIPCYVDQLGERPRAPEMMITNVKGTDVRTWPKDLRVRQTPDWAELIQEDGDE